MLAAAMAHTTAFRRAPFDRPLLRELRSAVDLGMALPWDAQGSGPAVVLIPGFLASDASLRMLATGIARHGYRPLTSGIERDVACSGATVQRLINRLEVAAAQDGAPVAVCGRRCRTFPYLSPYSRRDGFVVWRACLDALGRHRESTPRTAAWSQALPSSITS